METIPPEIDKWNRATSTKRTAELQSSISIKINVGNFESIDVTKTVKTEVEYETPDELKKKQTGFDTSVIRAAKTMAEIALTETGRKRISSDKHSELPLWSADE